MTDDVGQKAITEGKTGIQTESLAYTDNKSNN